ncbi:MAG: LysR substrate-binding domain-containing protein [Acetobacterales bacterium]
MVRRLPPLRALQAFEATVRRGSASAAAAELSVTHGAVSKQLRILEERLGRPLFERAGARLLPGEDAAAFARLLTRAFDLMADGAKAIQAAPEAVQPEDIKVVAPATFAMRWLLPRLYRFHAARPDITVAVRTANVEEDWRRLDFDLAILRSNRGGGGIEEVPFLTERNTLLAAPSLLPRGRAMTLDDVRRGPLLESGTRPGDLAAWLAAAGLDLADCPEVRSFPRFYVTLEAALDGLGCIVGPLPVLIDDVRDGRLAVPFPDIAVPGLSYVCAVDPAGDRAAEVRVFVDWLTAEAGGNAPAAATGRNIRR